MKRIIHSAEWGRVVEYVRYRGKRGRFVTDKWGRYLERIGSPYLYRESEQWLLGDKGKRIEKVTATSPDVLLKTTYPGSVADNEGNIYESLRSTNVFSQIDKAEKAVINIRGFDESGNPVRLQGEITLGQRNQDMQLTMATRAIMADAGYRTFYALKVVKSPRIRKKVSKLEQLQNTQFSVILYR